ncbi:Protein-arginine kinase activator protein [bacterium HR36]|nr:Protein-arginine kinase activator protein [bacterium HR36]
MANLDGTRPGQGLCVRLLQPPGAGHIPATHRRESFSFLLEDSALPALLDRVFGAVRMPKSGASELWVVLRKIRERCAAMKCQRCNEKRAVFHITEILGKGQHEELHLCEECGARYLAEPMPDAQLASGGGSSVEPELLQHWEQLRCPECGGTLKDFRNTGRLGCPHDYNFFRDQLQPLLQSIHGDVQHVGKVPERNKAARELRQELARLRRQMQELVNLERYEEAAQLRDRIRDLETRANS